MLTRITTFIIACFVLLMLTLALFSSNSWFFGVLAGALLWLAWDAWHGLRLNGLLQAAQLGTDALSQWKMPIFSGQWGEAWERMQRLLRDKDRALAAERNRHAAFLQAIQNSPNGVVLLDKERRIEWCNQTAAQHLGLDAQRDIAQHIGNLVRDPAFTAYLQAAKAGEEIVVSGALHSLHRPVRISVQLHAYAQPADASHSNSGGGALLLSRDVTAVEQTDAMRRDFVANVSHEIRTPLTVLSGFVETLQTLPLDAAQRSRYLGLMAQQSQRMQDLVSDLLTLSKLEGSPMPNVDRGVTVHALLSRVEADSRVLLGLLENPQRLRFEEVYEGDGIYQILGVESELLSAMQNLVSNALRYTPPLGVVQVRWQLLPDGRGQFTVTDTGPGIAPEHIARLTERFYRVDRSRSRESGGTGLGLSIVKHVVQRHGGELHIESTVGQGSSFWFTLPAARVTLV